MASLDDLKKRILSVKSTQKITKAMKMVAAAKLKRAQENAEKGRPYSEKMNNIILNLSNGISDKENAPKLLAGTGNDKVHLCVVLVSALSCSFYLSYSTMIPLVYEAWALRFCYFVYCILWAA